MKKIILSFLLLVITADFSSAAQLRKRIINQPIQPLISAESCTDVSLVGWHEYTPLSFCKYSDGVVRARGQFHSGNLPGLSSLIFTLPSDYRPPQDMSFYGGYYGHVPLGVVILSSGEVFVSLYGAGSDWWYTFDGLSFRTD